MERMLIAACATTPGGYGNCWGCQVADNCPTWQGTGAGRALVSPADTTVVVAVGVEKDEPVEACIFTPGCYGNCPHCSVAAECPTYLDTGTQRVLVIPSDPTVAVGVH